MVTEEAVREKLGNVVDPELGVNIVDLGLVYEIEVGEEVYIEMTLTTPACPLRSVFEEEIKGELTRLEDLENDDIEVELTFEPRWTPDKMNESARDELGRIGGISR